MAARGYVARSGTSATNVTPVALAAGVAKTVVAMLGASSDTLNVDEIGISFDGVAPAAVPAIVELLEISALGTVTSFTPVQLYGPTQPSSASAGYNASGVAQTLATAIGAPAGAFVTLDRVHDALTSAQSITVTVTVA
jgi:hypothetical protein